MKSEAILFLFISSMFGTDLLARQDTYATIMKRVDDEYISGDLSTALQDAHAAVTLNSQNYRAHYYLGLIYFRLEHAKEALDEATTALPLATEDAKASVQELVGLATSMSNAATLRDKASKDEADGLLAKAADEYAKAYLSYRKWTDVGFKAANLFGSLNDLAEQANIVRALSNSTDTNAAKQASQWLQASQLNLSHRRWEDLESANALVYGDLLWKASDAQRNRALRLYEDCTKAMPQEDNCWSGRFRLEANWNGIESLKNDLKVAATFSVKPEFHYSRRLDSILNGPSNITVIDGAWDNLVCDPSFVQFLTDLYGQDMGDKANDVCKEFLKTELEAAAKFVRDDDLNEAKAAYAVAVSLYEKFPNIDPNGAIRTGAWNSLCWRGSLQGHASEVMDACEKAVKLSPSDYNARDSRGLARAVTGNTSGAIEDFQFFIDHTTEQAKKVQRQEWVATLNRGDNPFTPDLRKSLAGQ